jgi:3-oxoacyl-[acyl-carrier-protein] synthase-3
MAFLKGFGAYLPARVMENDEVAALAGCDAGWIANVSGIRQRRIAGNGETVAYMGAQAARNCLEHSAAASSSVGMLIVSSGSAEDRFPGPAAAVARELGLGDIPAIDLPVASAGSVFGMALAARLADAYGDILLIASEKMSAAAFREPVNKNVAVLFGDGAGAALIGGGGGVARILQTSIHSDGAFAADLRLPCAGTLEMNGPVVILQSSRKIPAAIREVLAASGRQPADVAAFIMHQANRNLMVRVAQALGVPETSFYSNIERYGNTSSASMLIAAAECAGSGGLLATPGSTAVFAGFGAGFHWGAVLAEAV